MGVVVVRAHMYNPDEEEQWRRSNELVSATGVRAAVSGVFTVGELEL